MCAALSVNASVSLSSSCMLRLYYCLCRTKVLIDFFVMDQVSQLRKGSNFNIISAAPALGVVGVNEILIFTCGTRCNQ